MKTLEWLIQPFDTAETNVHRNLHTTIRAGKPSWLAAFKLNFRVPLTLPPMNNVKSFGNRTVLPKLLPFPAFSPQPVSDKRLLQATLPEPQRPGHVPPAAQWLAGEGAGFWFTISPKDEKCYFISRYSPLGKLECRGEFMISNKQAFHMEQAFRFEHLSHCRRVRIRQENITIEFRRIEKKIDKANPKKIFSEDSRLQPVESPF